MSRLYHRHDLNFCLIAEMGDPHKANVSITWGGMCELFPMSVPPLIVDLESLLGR